MTALRMRLLAAAALVAALAATAPAMVVTTGAAAVATAVREWGGSLVAIRTDGGGARSVAYADSNFGSLADDTRAGLSGCLLTAAYSTVDGRPDRGAHMAPTGAVDAACVTDFAYPTASCEAYAPAFEPSICALFSLAAMPLNQTTAGICYAWTPSPLFGYRTSDNRCPYGWTGRAGSPWYYAGSPAIVGTCSEYSYACSGSGQSVFFGTTAANTDDAIVPYFAIDLTPFGGSLADRLCITSFELTLTVQDAGVGCAAGDYVARLVGARASWDVARSLTPPWTRTCSPTNP